MAPLPEATVVDDLLAASTASSIIPEMGAKEAQLTSNQEEPADVKPSSSLTILLECNIPVITLTPPPTEEHGICAREDACLSSDEVPQASISQEVECYSVTFEMIGVNTESESIVVISTTSLPQCSAPDEKLSSSIADLAVKCDSTSFEDTNTNEWGVIVKSASSLSSSISWDPELSQSIQCLGIWIEKQCITKQRKTSTCDDEKATNTHFQLLYGDDAEMKCTQEAVDAEYDQQLQEDFNPLLTLGYNTPLLFKPCVHYYDASKSLSANDESSLASSDDSTCFFSVASSMSDDLTCLSPIPEVKVAAGMQDKVAWMCPAGDPCGPFTLHACHESWKV
ncbi:uncharacterized protein LAESUDRAFT_711752 [Laetiporus sulphureus 93-53]|uniref:Uncharacterized protein n=1 Tax=Laetiporus sulphureus 93-53 TaxID=1314785 RepID=A0A165G5V6_9APHY|nr:uncharacterized protein LAESUDRAFT_711752 [Laetiporus sulphureus 93-53]KZT09868.1 hypothetical protein LAESUDRAFT_711752 [Laetiporus sulphureus 93-53]